jgi:hypothetical protein
MTPRDLPDDQENQRVEYNKRLVETLQDAILRQVEEFASLYADCDRAALPIAIYQAYVAQCLKTYGEPGFRAAREQAGYISDEMEAAYRRAQGGFTM